MKYSDSDGDIDHGEFWVDSEGRSKFKGDDGAIIHISRLTAVAEYGLDAVRERVVHHGLQADVDDETTIRPDVPEWLIPMTQGEHRRLHWDGEYDFGDGIPLLRPINEGNDDNDDTNTESDDDADIDCG